MRTPSDDEPGTTPLATARARPGEGGPQARPLGALRDRLRFSARVPGPASHANATEPSYPANAAAPPSPANAAAPVASALSASGPPARTSLAIEPPGSAEGTDSTVGNGHGHPPETAGPPQAPSGPRRRAPWLSRLRPSPPWVHRLILVAWPVGLATAGVGLYLCYLAVSRTQAVGSDGASIAVQAWAMLHGNPLLRGWR